MTTLAAGFVLAAGAAVVALIVAMSYEYDAEQIRHESPAASDRRTRHDGARAEAARWRRRFWVLAAVAVWFGVVA